MPDPAATSWHATLLGAARVEGPHGPVERLRTRAAFLLLVFLLLNRGRAHARDELCDRFWPDDEPEAARGKLRLALHSIRGALGDLLEADRHAVWVARPEAVRTDRDELLRLVSAKEDRDDRLTRAVELYRGPFLPGFYDDWAVEERERLEGAVGRALREIAEGHAAGGRWPLALEAAGKLVALEPYDEAANLLVLRGLRETGRREALVRTLEWIRERFAEVGSRPGAAIEAFGRTEEPGTDTDEETALLGREADLAHTLREIEAGPVVTIWGPPGVGKTRLAREAVRTLGKTASGRRATFVSAVGLASAEALAGALRPALGGDAAADLTDLAEVASPRLLVVDNLESLPDEAVALFADLRARNPGLRFLFTSQRRTGLAEEVVVPLAPLAVPPEGASAAQVAASTSVRLLRERARERGRRLRVDESNAGALAALCRRLEGLPLALELAAEWLDVIGPADILDRLDEGARRLDARLPGRDPRHRSLETAIAASLGRLDERLRAALRVLAVFLGGWDLPAAEAVLGEEAAAILAEIESRALVKPEFADGRVRYAMLESIRLLLVAATPPADRAAALRRHADHYGERTQIDAADDENVRQAVGTLLDEEPDAERVGRTVLRLQPLWRRLGRWELAKASIRRALDRLDPVPTRLRASLYGALANASAYTDDHTLAERSCEDHRDVLLAMGDVYGAAVHAEQNLALARMGRGDFEGALPPLRAALDAARRGPRPDADTMITAHNLGDLLMKLGRIDEGTALLEESIALAAVRENKVILAISYGAIGWGLRCVGRLAEAEPYLRRAVALCDAADDRHGMLSGRAQLAILLAERSGTAEARRTLAEMRPFAVEVNRPFGYAEAAEAGAWTAGVGDALRASWFLGAAEAWRRRASAIAPLQEARLRDLRAAVRDAMGSEAYTRGYLGGETASRTELVEALGQVTDG